MAYDDTVGPDPRRDRDGRDRRDPRDRDWEGHDRDPDPREPRGRRLPGDLPEPRGRASVPSRDGGPRPGRPMEDLSRPPVPPTVARARVRQIGPDGDYVQPPAVPGSPRRASGRDHFEPLPPEPAPVVARASVGEPGQGGRHARGGVPGLPRRLQLGAGGLRGRVLAIVVALALMLAGGGVLGGATFFDSVQISEELTFPSTTKILYSDGTELARLGEQTRYELPYEHIEENIKIAIVASEDETFWTNDGIDFSGVMRAAWNNFTGGYTQGASTITQQYARLAFDLEGVTYQRKMREAVLAWKMTKDMSKAQILGAYLNAVSFGRGANGVEAAAKAFFGKDRTVDNTAAPEKQLTLAEAIVLVAMVKQPYPDPDDPEGHPGYDPKASPAADANARARFDYVKGQLVQTGKITNDEAAQLTFPETVQDDVQESNGMDGPGGLVVNQVLSELTHTQGSPFYGYKNWTAIKQGGYQIYTTLHPGAQAAAIKAVNDALANQPAQLQPALVAIQPGTGRVLAYYGGDNGIGLDYAGTYLDENGEVRGSAHPPGSSFKIYTLAAALKAGYSLNSYWDWQPHDMGTRTGNNRVTNVANCGDMAKDDPTPCSLLQSTISSLNVPFYAVTLSVGAVNVLSMAHAAGIDEIWTNEGERVDLKAAGDMGQVVPSKIFNEVGIGQYPVTVLDHATGVATIAAGGLRADHHFVEKVTKADAVIYGETISAGGERLYTPQQSNDLTYALSQVGSAKLNIGWDTAGKTGTWETKDHRYNAHAWMVGFSRTIAAAVWLGNEGDEARLQDKNGKDIYGSGMPATIWKSFMAGATAALNLPKQNNKFNAPNFVGDKNPDGSVPSPTPSQPGPGGPGWPGFPGGPGNVTESTRPN